MIHLGKSIEVEGRITREANTGDSYRLLFEKSPQPMWVFDEETTRFLAVNDAALRHYGYERSEFLTMTVKDVRPKSELPGLLEYRSQLTMAFIEFGAPTQWTHCRKDGMLMEVECKGATILFDDRRARLILIEDITERIRVTERMREHAEHFQILFDGTTDGVALHEDGIIAAANPALAVMLGCSAGNCVGQSLLDYAAPESRAGVLAAFRTASLSRLDFALRHQDGSRLRVQGYSRSLHFHGRPAQILILRDVEARVFAEFSEGLRDLTKPPK